MQHASQEYKSLSTEEKKTLLDKYTSYRESKVLSLHATDKSKVNDITETLKAIKDEVHFFFPCDSY
ncbi:hypothetical protein PISMIDRAFT_117048 [Pisolithus microcarpus 441]|uniref:Uncharacterized protein n=1 Tax=Pisolithus microcarpus 441 TaxID=765257 RepID=A0A0C9YKT7_9AGAM|nr:hypothetical protein PISMIDRAFT_117048 [Pisolithus microcarpus 441]